MKSEERFLSAQADTLAVANMEEKASACCARNDVGKSRSRVHGERRDAMNRAPTME